MPPKTAGFPEPDLNARGRKKAGFPMRILENRPLLDCFGC
jgi:hypothetical protein